MEQRPHKLGPGPDPEAAALEGAKMGECADFKLLHARRGVTGRDEKESREEADEEVKADLDEFAKDAGVFVEDIEAVAASTLPLVTSS
jgi:hypothetical protein